MAKTNSRVAGEAVELKENHLLISFFFKGTPAALFMTDEAIFWWESLSPGLYGMGYVYLVGA